MDKRAEIISTVERRRRWTSEEKLQILDEALSQLAAATNAILVATGVNTVAKAAMAACSGGARLGLLVAVPSRAAVLAKDVPQRRARCKGGAARA